MTDDTISTNAETLAPSVGVQRRVLPPVRCDWPGCMNEPICTSGNVNGALVCREHFSITNGPGPWTQSQEEALYHMAREAGRRRVGTCRECGGLGQVYSYNPGLWGSGPNFPCPSCCTGRRR